MLNFFGGFLNGWFIASTAINTRATARNTALLAVAGYMD